jgi:hypothetical protein
MHFELYNTIFLNVQGLNMNMVDKPLKDHQGYSLDNLMMN